ncbi:MAG: cell division protein ZapE [Marinicella sp.]
MDSPQQNYLAEIEAGIIWRDELQAQVVEEFERLHIELSVPPKKSWLFGKKNRAPKGIYIYGSVGRGKTHLMDLFFDSLPNHVGKQRQHYHEFMLWLHHELRRLPNQSDPLEFIFKQLAKQTQILCLDEFLVNDIANAMLLAGMLEAFSRYGIALVTTSNVQPNNLYKDGLQRAKFLPAIDWINNHMQVMHLDGQQDYRQNDEQDHEDWYFPINASSQFHLDDCFKQLAGNQQVSNSSWTVNDRQVAVIKSTKKVLWCDFSELCQKARNASDYIKIAKQIDTIVISKIPQMSKDQDNEARRFITLIDVLYEAEVKIIAQAACHYKMIYQGQKLKFEFERAASRLSELLRKP